MASSTWIPVGGFQYMDSSRWVPVGGAGGASAMEFWAERGVGGGAGGASAKEFWVEMGEGGGRGVRRHPVRRGKAMTK